MTLKHNFDGILGVVKHGIPLSRFAPHTLRFVFALRLFTACGAKSTNTDNARVILHEFTKVLLRTSTYEVEGTKITSELEKGAIIQKVCLFSCI